MQNMLNSMDSFMEICENVPDLHRHRDKLNTFLNHLNTCDFKYVQSIELAKVSIEYFPQPSEKKTGHQKLKLKRIRTYFHSQSFP